MAEPLTLARYQRRAMATTFEVALPLAMPQASPAAEDALSLVNRLEAQLTVYLDDSEISRINRHAASGPIVVEPQLCALLELAASIYEETDGAYDVAVGALIKSWGFYRRQGQVPDPQELSKALALSGMKHVTLDRQKRTIQFRQRDVELNLGSIGKGFALDRAAEQLRTRWNIHRALLHGGSSSVLALGTPPGDPRGWCVGLGHPTNLRHRVGNVWLKNQALGTSSATFHHLTHQGKKLGHILDPAHRLAGGPGSERERHGTDCGSSRCPGDGVFCNGYRGHAGILREAPGNWSGVAGTWESHALDVGETGFCGSGRADAALRTAAKRS